ncbi:MAG: hypothetical protein MUF30_12995 [Burkholderiales bacterium]|nr:hypothetical protein [Burkholderiales bacterium]
MYLFTSSGRAHAWLGAGSAAAALLADGAATLTGAVLRARGASPAWLEWPHPLHWWLVETLAIMLLGFVVVAWITRGWWRAWWPAASPARRALVLCSALTAAEVGFGGAFWVTRHQTYASMGWLPTLFSLSTEWRPPTLFATAQWWLAGWLAAQCRRLSGRGIWGFVAAACVFLGADELLSIHEFAGNALKQSGWVGSRGARSVDLGPIHTFYWPIVYVPLAGVVGLVGLRGLLGVLRPPQLALLVLAGTVFLTGAVGFELLEATGTARTAGWWTSDRGSLNLLIEESLEAFGVTLAVGVFAHERWRLRAHAR